MTASDRQRARRQRVEELCAASLRALSGDASLLYRGRQLYRGTQRLSVHAPHLRVDSDEDDFADCRGAADGMALRLLHSDPDIHREFCPGEGDRIARLMFEWLEQMRAETLVRDDMPGMRRNLLQRFERWSRDFYRAGLTEGRLGILLYTAAQMCWLRLTARRALEETEGHIESTRFMLAGRIGIPLAGMRRQRNDQRKFAQYALEIACVIGGMARGEQPEGWRDDNAQAEIEDREADSRFALLLDCDPGEGEVPAVAASGESRVFADAGQAYRIYTTRYDTEVDATSLVRQALLREYREKLDRRVAEQGISLPRLVRLLRTVLAEPCRDGWLFGEEEGHIDGRRLARLISAPGERRVFRQDRCLPVSNCLVSFLVDCSGSMKTHIESVATLIDILLRALDMAGVSTELLGFTTGAWNGGRAWRDWQRAGAPEHPGRLNEACHMVFKSAARSWRRARSGVAALLKSDLFREGIDGEAVDWACQRMLAHGAARRILIVISDGCPGDAATGRANDAFYLDNHLKDVVARRGLADAVDIIGLGVGLDLGPFYPRSLATDPTEALDNALFNEIVQLIGRKRRR